MDPHRWLELRRFRSLNESGAMSLREIAAATGLNRRTVAKYLSGEVPMVPPKRAPSTRPRQRVVDEVAPLIDAMLRAEILLKGAVIHERLVPDYGFTGNYQRVKIYLQEARPRIAAELGISPGELAGLHRRFEVVPGAQAQVDWGDEGKILAHVGIGKVYSFHMTLSYSRDPFCCFTTSQDLASFFDCHRRAFEHFGGVPMSIVYDRTKTVVRRHVAPGETVPLHPEAVAFAGHYDFDPDVLAACRPTGKGRVERQVAIVRDHVLAGRAFSSIEELDAAFVTWVPLRRSKVHGTHGEVIGVRAVRDHMALRPRLPRMSWPSGRATPQVRPGWRAATETTRPDAPGRAQPGPGTTTALCAQCARRGPRALRSPPGANCPPDGGRWRRSRRGPVRDAGRSTARTPG
ncbi:IS21 family transposase [Nonomuraea sp. NPDC049269]|uniref:IS21 family transposase n=1 Tax=Nonomuraea sp. NPDC049269 TaxID=3364349 RepID=UPI0037153CFF